MKDPRIFRYLILALLFGLLLTMIFSVKEGFGGHPGDIVDSKKVDCTKKKNANDKECRSKN